MYIMRCQWPGAEGEHVYDSTNLTIVGTVGLAVKHAYE